VNYCAIETSFWIRARSDAALSGVVAAILGGEATLFNVAVPSVVSSVPPVKAVFALAGRAALSSRHSSIAFTWSHKDGFPLPSMYGEIVARRLGPLTSVRVRARYAYDDGAAGRLFHEAIGDRIGRKIFGELVGAIRSLLARPRRHREQKARL
jgi:hypothetical protein